MPGSHVLPIWAAELREMTVAKTKDVRFQASLVTAQMSASGAKPTHMLGARGGDKGGSCLADVVAGWG